jgi:cytochrome P450
MFDSNLARLLTLLKHKHDIFNHFCSVTKKLGWTWEIALPRYPTVYYVGHPKDVQHALDLADKVYVKGWVVYEGLYTLLGNGIFTVDHEAWRLQRKAASHLFKKRLLVHASTVFVDTAADLVEVFRDAASRKAPLDVQQLFSRYTLQVFTTIAFGIKVDMLTTQHPFAEAFDGAVVLLEDRLTNPFWKWLPWHRFAMWRYVREVDRFVYGVIDGKITGTESTNVGAEEDILSRFRALCEGTTFSELGGRIALRDAVINFLIAGRDTTAQLLSWSLYMLATHPEEQEVLLREVSSVLGDEALPTVDTTKSLVRMRAFLDEVLRLYPPVPLNILQCTQDDVLPHTGVRVPAGNNILWSSFVLGRDDRIFDDPLKFDPTRHISEDGKNLPVHPTFAFKVGPRTCLGINFAYLEVTIVLTTLLRSFSFVVDTEPVIQPAVTLRAEHGVMLMPKEKGGM